MIRIAIGMFVLAVIALVSANVGWRLRDLEAKDEALVRAQKTIVKQERLLVEVPKIVETVVYRTKTVEKEVERVVTVIHKTIPPECVLPAGYAELLVIAARGIDPNSPTVANEISGAYGCREVLNATLKDLEAGWVNSARLSGLQEWVHEAIQP